MSAGTRIYGGMVVGQIIVAAGRALAPRQVHSVQQVFLRPGRSHVPLDHTVTTAFEGRTFASAHVQVHQEDELISHAIVGLTAGNADGPERATEMPTDVVRLADTVNRDQVRQNPDWDDQPIEFRVDTDQHNDTDPRLDLWFRPAGPVPDEPLLHRALLGYITDRALLYTAWKPHRPLGDHSGATLDHSLWFHDEIDLNRWHVHVLRSPAVGDDRGMVFGSIFTEEGRLVASTAQQGVLRVSRQT